MENPSGPQSIAPDADDPTSFEKSRASGLNFGAVDTPSTAPASMAQHSPGSSVPQLPDLRARLTRILETLIEKDPSKIFSEPVSRELYPEYFQIITSPMDLGTIQQRLAQDHYSESALHQVCALPLDPRVVTTSAAGFRGRRPAGMAQRPTSQRTRIGGLHHSDQALG